MSTLMQANAQAAPTNWAFGQLSRTLGAPSGYLQKLPAPLAARCLMQGVKDTDKAAVKVLTLSPDDTAGDNAPRVLQAVTSPTYGRIWDAEEHHSLDELERYADSVREGGRP